MGSSPRMRGTHANRQSKVYMQGIIPAYAGNTVLLFYGVSLFWDHPRVCGEHRALSSSVRISPGSSPRMRGTLHQAGETDRRSGIIPAYAGNTLSHACRRLHHRDHPRVCGEHRPNLRLQRLPQGSSPRMRGTPSAFRGGCVALGIIPAYAGNTPLMRFTA